MLTFALDEYGDFEGVDSRCEPVFIAGIIYDDKGEAKDTDTERRRIEAYYKAVIHDASLGSNASQSFHYPSALHVSERNQIGGAIVGPVKELVAKSIREFLELGTYKGRPLPFTDFKTGETKPFVARKGKYQAFVILKSDLGMSSLLSNNANYLAKDNFGSNLYFHMVNALLSRIVFYNPFSDGADDIVLELATRASRDLNPSDSLYQQYKKLGYRLNRVHKGDSDGFYCSLTNPDVYRTVLAQKIMDSEQLTIKIHEFKSQTISYSESRGMEFLYLADSVCSILSREMKGDNADQWLESVLGRVASITGRKDNLVFGYDEVDNLFEKAWKRLLERDYYKALSIAFDARKLRGSFAKYYDRRWFPLLEQRVIERCSADIPGFNMAVRKLNETLNNNDLDVEKALYILQILLKIEPSLRRELYIPESKRILYMLYDIGVTAYCHIGDSRNAEAYFDRCRDYIDLVSVDALQNTLNKLVVLHCDYFNFDYAAQVAAQNIEHQEWLNEARNQYNSHHAHRDVEEVVNVSYGKALSQRGQVYAFKRDQLTESLFREALKHLLPDSADYKITQSYLLHYYLDNGMEDAYRRESILYFGGKEKLKDQLDYILSEGAKQYSLINMRYAFYVFLKGVFLFRQSEMTSSLWRDIQNIEQKFAKKSQKAHYSLVGHPSELIFKYLSFLAASRGEHELKDSFSERAKTCLNYQGATERVILLFAEMESAQMDGNIGRRDSISEDLLKLMQKEFSVFGNQPWIENADGRYQWLSNHITYMYR